jgi:MerR family transcriptional regulator, copper efflux regulator
MSTEPSGTGLLINQVAGLVGMAPSALRYYEQAGLLPPIERTAAGYRRYRPEAVVRIRFIQSASAHGLKLTEIRDLIEASPRDAESEQSVMRAAISRKIDETRSKIADLTHRTNALLRVEEMLANQALPSFCHLGDCTCWFPEVASTQV